ncbi:MULTISPECIES: hypothetical protein [unclassified Kitasatospora]|uniref:hypothetical protein n=1 Tax=unclassified Kitasatospora TaxID=2633591 RepID=UPI0012FBE874|nr:MULTISPECIES: hypothetical protein [unclassified Kitasatospora]
MTWDVPGLPQIAAIHVHRDLDAGTFRFDYSREPLVALAQRWLIARGADPTVIARQSDGAVAPADSATTDLEERLRLSGDRFDIRDDYTDDTVTDPERGTEGLPSSGPEWAARLQYSFYTWAIARDTQQLPGQPEYRVFFEEIDMRADTYTLREGGFETWAAASDWTQDTSQPLPPIPAEEDSARAAAARGRSTQIHSRPGPPAAPPQAGPTPPDPARGR